MMNMLDAINNIKVEPVQNTKKENEKVKVNDKDVKSFEKHLNDATNKVKSKKEDKLQQVEDEKPEEVVSKIDEQVEAPKEEIKELENVIKNLLEELKVLLQKEEIPEEMIDVSQELILGLESLLKELQNTDSNKGKVLIQEYKGLEIRELIDMVQEINSNLGEKAINTEELDMIKTIVDKANVLVQKSEETVDVPETKVDSKIDTVEVKVVQEAENNGTNTGSGSEESSFKESKPEEKEMDVLNSILNVGKKNVSATSFYGKLNNIQNADQKQTVRANHMTYDVVKNIKFMTNNDLKEMTLRIIPKELGEITIKVTMDAGILKANIAAVNKDTAELLQNNGTMIQEKLEESGLKLDKVEVEIYQEDTTFFSDGKEEGNFKEQYKRNLNPSETAEESLDDEIDEIDDEYSINAMV